MLESNLNIMTPQWLDVIFKDRNQAYGAYELRRNNAANTSRALLISAGLFVLALSLPTVINKIRGFIPEKDVVVHIIDAPLIQPPAIAKELPPAPPVQQKQVRSQVDQIKFPPPVVMPDERVHTDPPTDKMLENANPGPETIKGDKNGEIAIDEKVSTTEMKGVTESPDDNTILNAVEINPEFPGGEAAFGKFLQSHIRYPSVAKENGVQGRVFVQFVVERDGSLTDLKVLRDPGSGLGEEASRVLKISPHWKPGIQNGRAVRVQYTVPVNFSLAE